MHLVVTLRSGGQRLCSRVVVGLIAEHSVFVDVQELAGIDHTDQ